MIQKHINLFKIKQVFILSHTLSTLNCNSYNHTKGQSIITYLTIRFYLTNFFIGVNSIIVDNTSKL